jgi:hypothetical protein
MLSARGIKTRKYFGGKLFREQLPSKGIFFSSEVTPRERKIIVKQIAKHPEWLDMKKGKNLTIGVQPAYDIGMPLIHKSGRLLRIPAAGRLISQTELGDKMSIGIAKEHFTEGIVAPQEKHLGPLLDKGGIFISQPLHLTESLGHEFMHVKQVKEHKDLSKLKEELAKQWDSHDIEKEAHKYGESFKKHEDLDRIRDMLLRKEVK